ncbi:uncharacterized protein FOMMEDRAFT_26826 [Fomitiporia mediterranea MF3/22]|uniref:uncharacterized protein n=1 Tax=Fomitiporia mediterranea (strain MF3/22) TaxID=694068 RepID=UPI000440833D|nr:uncharacterized protein FOMMEDRAFT_26826 [Fomitiporia mediterranea MF3/22]EJD06058.1 hypothetical protein FOMMEDRAFT_26826 [Fomitiporia mediterranea MF3/22]
MSKRESSGSISRRDSSNNNPKYEFDKAFHNALKTIVNVYVEVQLQTEITSLQKTCNKVQEETKKSQTAKDKQMNAWRAYQDETDKHEEMKKHKVFEDEGKKWDEQDEVAKAAVIVLITEFNILINTIKRDLDVDPQGRAYIDRDLKKKNIDLQKALTQVRDAVLDASTIHPKKLPTTLKAASKVLESMASADNSAWRGQVKGLEIYNDILALDKEMSSEDESAETSRTLQSGKAEMERYKKSAEALQIKVSVHDKREEAMEEFRKAIT